MTQHPNLIALDGIILAARHPDIRNFASHIRSIHPPDRLPSRTAFDPLAVPRLLSGIVMVEVERRPEIPQPRFRVTVAGQAVLDASPVPMMGCHIDEIASQITGGRVVLDVRQQVLQTGSTYYWYGPPRMKFRYDFAQLEYVHCPLAEDGKTIDHIISMFHYEAMDIGAGP